MLYRARIDWNPSKSRGVFKLEVRPFLHQTALYSTPLCRTVCKTVHRSVKTIPTIPKEAQASGANILKPTNYAALQKIGSRVRLRITKPHVVNTVENKNVFSVPVKSDITGEGQLPLNKTNMGYLAQKLGDNSDTWVDHEFEAVVVPQKNPNTGAQVLSWSIDKDSIK